MLRNRRVYITVFSAIVLSIASSVALISQNTGRRSAALIHDKIDENQLVSLAGNTRPEANADNDLGPVGDGLSLDHMMLQLKRSPEQEKAAAGFVDDLHDRKSANFHKWISATEFGKNFGLAESDIRTITGWLESHGFVVNTVYPSGMVIDFSGSAGQVARAFHTSLHNLDVDGVRHIANMSDPQIPAALAPAVAGVISLHDFRPHRMVRPRSAYTYTSQGTTTWAVVPADLATIYDFNPLFNKGITGVGQTIVVMEDTDLYTSEDWNTFRSTFGLSHYSAGSLTTSHPAPPGGVNNCYDPGVNSDDSEAIIDTEWASAAAPGAAIVVGACGDTVTTFGGFIAMANLVNGSNPPTIMSISYSECESENGASSNASIVSLYQQAVAEGVSVFISAGDQGAAGCDTGTSAAPATNALHGVAVNAFASTVYNVAAGGTDFSPGLDNTGDKYWSNNNSGTYGSALSYIPEIPWNGSCASGLMATYFGFATGYGKDGFCNSSTAAQFAFVEVSAGSGGPSSCATGAPETFGSSNGSCKGTPKPSWQTGLSGIPNDGVRDLPDVSMFASNGVWGSYYVYCFSDPDNGGTPCKGDPSNWAGAGGTSFASPILAGIQALVNQNAGGAQGNPNPVYYALAAGANASSIFHSITRGDIDVNCGGKVDCFGSDILTGWGREGRGITAGAPGGLSLSSTTFTPAYAAGPSWNFATGIGSVDVNNLVTNWINQ
jgi:subtilase family serine protease